MSSMVGPYLLDRVYQGDCLEMMKALPGGVVDLVVADFPYNIGKADWDRIPNYDVWCMERIKQFERVLKPNGCFYIYHMDFEQVTKFYFEITQHTRFRFKQFIVINKGIQAVAGRTSPSLRSYPKSTEYLLFFTFDDFTGTEQLSDTLTALNPMAKYLRAEFERAGVSQGDIRRLFPSKSNGETGCVTNWLKGYNFPLKWQYDKIKKFLNLFNSSSVYLKREYVYLKREYEDLKREYEEGRYVFNLPYGVTDVWDIYVPPVNEGHPTQKSLSLSERIINSSTNPDGIVLIPCVGSGSELVACKRLNRRFIGFETKSEYVTLAERRLANVPRRLEEYL